MDSVDSERLHAKFGSGIGRGNNQGLVSGRLQRANKSLTECDDIPVAIGCDNDGVGQGCSSSDLAGFVELNPGT